MPPTQDQLQAFIDRHRELLSHERDAEITRTSLLLSNCSPRLLEQRGLALLNLGLVHVNVGLGGKNLIELERPPAYHSTPVFPPHSFRPGDLARIDDHSAAAATSKKAPGKKSTSAAGIDRQGVEGVVYKVSETRIVIAVELSDSASTELDLPVRCAIVKLTNTVTFKRMEAALDTLERAVLPSITAPALQDIAGSTSLARVLLNQADRSPPIPDPNLVFLDQTLNDSQKIAVRFALESVEVACIHGPPGTGKTFTLVEIIRQLVARGNRVLVCGASNLAVDNLLERLVPHGIPLTRIGHPARVLAPLLASTLDSQATRSEQFALAKDVKNEIDAAMASLTGKGKGKLKGPERRKMWDEVRQLRKEYRKREGSVVKGVVAQAKIVLATCHSAGGRQLQNEKFDVVVIDEATQALEAVCWIPIFKGRKLILAGDPLQLPPTIISNRSSVKNDRKSKREDPEKIVPVSKGASKRPPIDDASDSNSNGSDSETPIEPIQAKAKPKDHNLKPPRSLEQTLFSRLERTYGPSVKRMLTVQYRMHKQIATFPSKTLYASSLISHSSVAEHRLRDLPGVSQDGEHGDVLEVPVLFFDTAGLEYFERLESDTFGGDDEGSRCNENEATVVKFWAEKLVQAGLHPSQIAIITPYQAQVTLLSSLLRPSMPELEIGSVDGMQGREKEAVILSLVRSNDKREVGFLKEKRRLNVAMTRARRHLCIVGDSSTIKHGNSYLKKWMLWLEANADVRFAEVE